MTSAFTQAAAHAAAAAAAKWVVFSGCLAQHGASRRPASGEEDWAWRVLGRRESTGLIRADEWGVSLIGRCRLYQWRLKGLSQTKQSN